MRTQSRNADDDGLEDLDPYMTCEEAIKCLLKRNVIAGAGLGGGRGTGVVVHALQQPGRTVLASDPRV